MKTAHTDLTATPPTLTRVWDLPTRVFHWALVICMIGAIVSVKIGGNAMQWHARFGYAILVLITFRIVWGFVGGRYARFSSFLPNPLRALAYLRGQLPHQLGHNPLGALSVYALLVVIGGQAIGGLFTNDDIAFDGPLVKWVSREASNFITTLHKWNEKVIYALLVLHICAILYYVLIKKQRLIRPMIDGNALGQSEFASQDNASLRIRAFILLAALTALVYWLVS